MLQKNFFLAKVLFIIFILLAKDAVGPTLQPIRSVSFHQQEDKEEEFKRRVHQFCEHKGGVLSRLIHCTKQTSNAKLFVRLAHVFPVSLLFFHLKLLQLQTDPEGLLGPNVGFVTAMGENGGVIFATLYPQKKVEGKGKCSRVTEKQS